MSTGIGCVLIRTRKLVRSNTTLQRTNLCASALKNDLSDQRIKLMYEIRTEFRHRDDANSVVYKWSLVTTFWLSVTMTVFRRVGATPASTKICRHTKFLREDLESPLANQVEIGLRVTLAGCISIQRASIVVSLILPGTRLNTHPEGQKSPLGAPRMWQAVRIA